MIYITAIHLDPPTANSEEHISSLEWRNPSSNERKTSTRSQMVAWIEKGGDAFVEASPDVRVVVVNADPKYVRTEANGTPTDNLLSLPRF